MIIDLSPFEFREITKRNKRRNFDGNFKAKVALEVIREKSTLSEIAAKYDIFPT
jgi:transposase